MSIATKNGSIIIKDGKLAEGCGCCGWYCDTVNCPSCVLITENTPSPAEATVYSTESDCLENCAKGACCTTANGVTICTVGPQCQCQGAGNVFKGIGTTCDQYKGACCFGSVCSVVPECECVGVGRIFKGIGTTCTTNLCPCYCPDGTTLLPDTIELTWSGGEGWMPPCDVSNCWVSFGPNFCPDPTTQAYKSSYDFLYPQIQGTYVMTRTSCKTWDWSTQSPLDGLTDSARVYKANTGFGQQYINVLSKAVTAPGGVCRITLSGAGAFLGVESTFFNDLCGGRVWTDPGINVLCGPTTLYLSGSGVSALSSECVWPGGIGKPPSGTPVFYVMQSTLTAGS